MAGPTASASLAARVAGEAAAMAPDIAIGILGDAIQVGPADIEQGLRALAVPRSAISSELFRPKDPAVFMSFGIDNVVLPGTGHYLMLEQPEAFNLLLARAVARSTID